VDTDLEKHAVNLTRLYKQEITWILNLFSQRYEEGSFWHLNAYINSCESEIRHTGVKFSECTKFNETAERLT
jgi:hypothetical protein